MNLNVNWAPPQETRGARASNRSMCQSVSFEVLYLNKWRAGWRGGEGFRRKQRYSHLHTAAVLSLNVIFLIYYRFGNSPVLTTFTLPKEIRLGFGGEDSLFISFICSVHQR